MTQYDNNLTGIISRNDKKTSDKHPDIKGQCEIDGVQYWVAGWSKTRNSDGGKFYSLKFERKDKTQAEPEPAPRRPSHDAVRARQLPPQRPASGFDDMADDIPW